MVGGDEAGVEPRKRFYGVVFAQHVVPAENDGTVVQKFKHLGMLIRIFSVVKIEIRASHDGVVYQLGCHGGGLLDGNAARELCEIFAGSQPTVIQTARVHDHEKTGIKGGLLIFRLHNDRIHQACKRDGDAERLGGAENVARQLGGVVRKKSSKRPILIVFILFKNRHACVLDIRQVERPSPRAQQDLRIGVFGGKAL